jgi:hypothetical protein
MSLLHTSKTIAQMAFLGFQRMRDRQQRQHEPGYLAPRDTHLSYPHSGQREVDRHLRHIAAGRIPTDQIGVLVDGRVKEIGE